MPVSFDVSWGGYSPPTLNTCGLQPWGQQRAVLVLLLVPVDSRDLILQGLALCSLVHILVPIGLAQGPLHFSLPPRSTFP